MGSLIADGLEGSFSMSESTTATMPVTTTTTEMSAPVPSSSPKSRRISHRGPITIERRAEIIVTIAMSQPKWSHKAVADAYWRRTGHKVDRSTVSLILRKHTEAVAATIAVSETLSAALAALTPFQRLVLDIAEKLAPDGRPLGLPELADATGTTKKVLGRVREMLRPMGLWRWPNSKHASGSSKGIVATRTLADIWGTAHIRRVESVVHRARLAAEIKTWEPGEAIKRERMTLGIGAWPTPAYPLIPIRPTKIVPTGWRTGVTAKPGSRRAKQQEEWDRQRQEYEAGIVRAILLAHIVGRYRKEWTAFVREGRNPLVVGTKGAGTGMGRWSEPPIDAVDSIGSDDGDRLEAAS